MHIAAGNDAHDVVGLLIDRGADVWTRSDQGLAPVDYAISKNARNAAKLLLNSSTHLTLLHVAAADNDHEQVKLLLEFGADVNAKNKDGWTPLHDAAAPNAVRVAQLLISHGADVNARGKNGRTPLHQAARGYAAEAARLLIDRGADVNATNKNGWTPLHDAAWGAIAVARLLIDRGADVKRDEQGRLDAAPPSGAVGHCRSSATADRPRRGRERDEQER